MTEPTLETETILLLFLSHKTNISRSNGGTGESASANIEHYFPVWMWVGYHPVAKHFTNVGLEGC